MHVSYGVSLAFISWRAWWFRKKWVLLMSVNGWSMLLDLLWNIATHLPSGWWCGTIWWCFSCRHHYFNGISSNTKRGLSNRWVFFRNFTACRCSSEWTCHQVTIPTSDSASVFFFCSTFNSYIYDSGNSRRWHYIVYINHANKLEGSQLHRCWYLTQPMFK